MKQEARSEATIEVGDHPKTLTESAKTAKVLFFTAAFLSFLMSVYLFFSGDHERGIFVGIWVPSILSAGALLLAGTNHGGKNHD